MGDLSTTVLASPLNSLRITCSKLPWSKPNVNGSLTLPIIPRAAPVILDRGARRYNLLGAALFLKFNLRRTAGELKRLALPLCVEFRRSNRASFNRDAAVCDNPAETRCS